MSKTTDTPRKRRFTLFADIFTGLGVLVAVLSLASLVQRWQQINLADVTLKVLGYYREVANQAKWLLFDWWLELALPEFILPSWSIDVLAIWILLGAAVWRGERSRAHIYANRLQLLKERGKYIAEVDRLYADFPRIMRERYGFWLLITPLAFLGYLNRLRIDLGDVATHWEVEKRVHRPSLDPIVMSLLFASSPIVGTIAFFTWNSLML